MYLSFLPGLIATLPVQAIAPCLCTLERTNMQSTSSTLPNQSAVLFPTGQIVATPGALRLMEQHHISPISLLTRHVQGDWGSVEPEDAASNSEAISQGNRILSSYFVHGDHRVWIITEWDRSVTTLLLPCEY